MNDWQTRYARQITLAGWGEQKQRDLAQHRVLVVGLGGLGSPVATYLAASGVGTLVLNDFDTVDLSNLPRQPLHTTADVGRLKADSAKETLTALNPDVNLELITQRLTAAQLTEQISQCSVVIDCSDNFGTRFNINQAAVQTRTPLISVAAIRGEGQLAVFRPDLGKGPCYRCLYDDASESHEDCQGQGVIASLVGVMGSLAATAAINLLVFDEDNSGSLTLFDARALSWRSLKLPRDPDCPVCAA